ncbi:MAG: NADH:flavin oxidoreductase, partial [Dongiaceae bacterium]
LNEWIRVRDYRVGQLNRMANVSLYRDSRLSAGDVREFGAAHVVIATGARWRGDGVGRCHHRPVSGSDNGLALTPEDVFAGSPIAGPVIVFDDEHYYMGGVVAEELRSRGLAVMLVTPAGNPSAWTEASLEQPYIQTRLLEGGIEIRVGQQVASIGNGVVELACTYTGRTTRQEARAVVMVTSRLPIDGLYHELMADGPGLRAAGIRSVNRIGDCLNPGTIAAAVYAGHRYARELDAPVADPPFRVEHVAHVG